MSSVLGTSCLQGFQNSPTDSSRCVPECSAQQGFELQVKNGVPACVYKTNTTVYFTLKSAPGLLASLVQKFPDISAFANYTRVSGNAPILTEYRTAIGAYTQDAAVATERIGKQRQIFDAFNELQVAENARDSSPDAYQQARVRYYTLLEGDAWADQERDRILNAEAKPKADGYLAQYTDLTTRRNQQQQTMDVVTAVKDKVLSMKDDFKMTTDVFSKQIAALKNQIQLESKAKAQTAANVAGWIDMLLNGLLVAVLLVAVFVIGRAVVSRAMSTYTSSPTIR